MRSIYNLVDEVNEELRELFEADKLKGSDINGVAELVSRDDKTIPEVNGKEVVVNDEYPVRIYHRLNSLSSTIKSGIGRTFDQTNSYALSMIVFLQKERTSLYPDSLTLLIQSNMPDRLQNGEYRNVSVTFNGGVMDSKSVWQQEYSTNTNYRLKSNQFLFKINYTIETTFSKGCFKKCP